MSLGDTWHLAVNGEKSGPHPLGELRGKLGEIEMGGADVRVWAPGMPDWVDPRTVPGLMEAGGEAADGGGEGAGAEAVNPYASPQTVEVASSEAVGRSGEAGNHDLDIGLCLSEGWRLTLQNFGKLILFGILYVVIVVGLTLVVEGFGYAVGAGEFAGSFNESGVEIEASSGASPGGTAVYALLQIVENLVSVFLGIGAAIFGLKMVRRENPEISNLFAGGPHFWSVLLATILFVMMVMVGLLLLIVPGIFLAVRFGQFQWAIIDQNLGPIEGLKASWEMTKGNVWRLIGLWIVMVGIVLVGALALVVGLVLAYPVVFLATVIAFQSMRYGAESVERVA
ncbi:MAG: GYF domain-containing protein [Verrucomicrobiota bacterium]